MIIEFNLDQFLLSLSFALDFLEMDLLQKSTNHGKRVAYISSRIGRRLGISGEDLFDLTALAILHDNGITGSNSSEMKKLLGTGQLRKLFEVGQEHCLIGEKNVEVFPFFKKRDNVILYHHEHFNGEGFFKIAGDEIPLFSRIIALADFVEIQYSLQKTVNPGRAIEELVEAKRGLWFSPDITGAFLAESRQPAFWLSMHDQFITDTLQRSYTTSTPVKIPAESLCQVTEVFSRIIDMKSRFTRNHSSGLTDKARVMAGFYSFNEEKSLKFLIAADLHDIGKLAIPNSILNKPDRLDRQEFEKIKEHTFYTRKSLERVEGFEEITEWASNHHEKLNGSGYPYGLTGEALDFQSRLMSCLDIYQALTEERPYRTGLTHREAVSILKEAAAKGELDGAIVTDIESVFAC